MIKNKNKKTIKQIKKRLNKKYRSNLTRRKEYDNIIFASFLVATIILGSQGVQTTTTIDKNAYKPILAPILKHETKEIVKNTPKTPEKTKKQIMQETADTIRQIAKNRNFKWSQYAVNICCCESLLGTKLRNAQNNIPSYSYDRGFFHINSYWHPEITDEQADNLVFSANWFMDRVEAGYQSEWMCDPIVKGVHNYSLTHCGIE